MLQMVRIEDRLPRFSAAIFVLHQAVEFVNDVVSERVHLSRLVEMLLHRHQLGPAQVVVRLLEVLLLGKRDLAAG